jgi:glycosyltransferase involved in cell wall biosynthesis
MSDPTIGLAVIMQNNETQLPRALTQFYHIVEDIVVVDAGSTDDSVGWAERLGARVFQRPFDNHFANQINFALDQLATDWIYVHTVDEQLEPQLIQDMPKLVTLEGQREFIEQGVLPPSETLFDCFGIARKSFIDGIQSDNYPDYQYRLFANYCKFKGRVFEQVVNFRNRVELDYKRTGEPEAEQDIRDVMARFNILQYKSSTKAEEQSVMYAKLKDQMDKEEEFGKK